jgi:uncharacterized protein
MSFLAAVQPLYVFSGLVVGLLVGLTGVGGGSLMTPLLILLFGIHPVKAVGTDLIYATVTKLGGTAVHGFNRTIDWRVVGRLALGSVPLTALTILTLYQLHISSNAAQILVTYILAAALLLTSLSLIFRKALMRLYAHRLGELSPELVRDLTVLTGAALGVLVSLSSVGAGAIGVTALILLYPNMPIARIVGTDIAHSIPLTLVAGLGHWMLGSINWQLLVSLLLGSIPGTIIGSLLAPRVPETALRNTLAIVLLFVCVVLVF